MSAVYTAYCKKWNGCTGTAGNVSVSGRMKEIVGRCTGTAGDC